jgi:hypothetical protein
VFPIGYYEKLYGKEFNSFNWSDYLKENKSRGAPLSAWKISNINNFEKIKKVLNCEGSKKSSKNYNNFCLGDKVESINFINPLEKTISVSTIIEINENKILIHHDGYYPKYDYWVEFVNLKSLKLKNIYKMFIKKK